MNVAGILAGLDAWGVCAYWMNGEGVGQRRERKHHCQPNDQRPAENAQLPQERQIGATSSAHRADGTLLCTGMPPGGLTCYAPWASRSLRQIKFVRRFVDARVTG